MPTPSIQTRPARSDFFATAIALGRHVISLFETDLVEGSGDARFFDHEVFWPYSTSAKDFVAVSTFFDLHLDEHLVVADDDFRALYEGKAEAHVRRARSLDFAYEPAIGDCGDVPVGAEQLVRAVNLLDVTHLVVVGLVAVDEERSWTERASSLQRAAGGGVRRCSGDAAENGHNADE